MRTSKDPVLGRLLALIPGILEAETPENYSMAEHALTNAACASRYMDLAHADFVNGSETSYWMGEAREACDDFIQLVHAGFLPDHLTKPLVKQLRLKSESYDLEIDIEPYSRRAAEVFA